MYLNILSVYWSSLKMIECETDIYEAISDLRTVTIKLFRCAPSQISQIYCICHIHIVIVFAEMPCSALYLLSRYLKRLNIIRKCGLIIRSMVCNIWSFSLCHYNSFGSLTFSLSFDVTVLCNTFYYGDCNTYCKPSDGFDGHASCDAAGNRVCLKGR